MFPPFMGWRFPLRGPLDNSLRVLQGWVSRRLKHSTSTAVSQQVTIDQRWKSLLMPNRKGRLGGFCEQEWNHACFAFPHCMSEWTTDDLAISDLCNTACMHPPHTPSTHYPYTCHRFMLLARLVCFWSIAAVKLFFNMKWSIATNLKTFGAYLKHPFWLQYDKVWSGNDGLCDKVVFQQHYIQETSSPTISQPSHAKLLECNAATACTVPAKDGVQRWRACAIDPFSPELWETASQLVFVTPWVSPLLTCPSHN